MFLPFHNHGFMRNVVLVLLIMLFLCGCELFTVRESDPPGSPPPWNDFSTQWEQSVQNLEYVYEDYRNAVKYSGLFLEQYSFHFAPQDVNDFSAPGTWNRSQEQDMIQLLHNHYQSIQVELQNTSDNDQISASEAKLYRSYIITGIQRTKSETKERETLAQGNLELQLRKEYGFWYISAWYDYRTETGGTWGRLKYENSTS